MVIWLLVLLLTRDLDGTGLLCLDGRKGHMGQFHGRKKEHLAIARAWVGYLGFIFA